MRLKIEDIPETKTLRDELAISMPDYDFSMPSDKEAVIRFIENIGITEAEYRFAENEEDKKDLYAKILLDLRIKAKIRYMYADQMLKARAENGSKD